jgi:1-deoxy-D-xylulose-5-phosphate synthase
MGVPDRIVEHGTQEELHDEIGIGVQGLTETIRTYYHQKEIKV